MRRVYIKRNKRGFFGIGLMVVVICGFLYYNSITTKAEVNAQQELLDSLTKTKNTLLKEQEELKNDTDKNTDADIERIAREKLDLVYPDEIIITPNGK